MFLNNIIFNRMLRLFQILLVCYVFLVVFLLFDCGEASQYGSLKSHHKQRRYLGFNNITHFFVRVNFKANMVPWNQFFAQALGFRLNYDDPPDNFYPHHHLHRRTIYKSLETLLDKNGVNGYHCVRRAICEMKRISEPQAIYHKILKIIFRQQSSATEMWHNLNAEECEASVNSCPFSLLEVSQYTDLG